MLILHNNLTGKSEPFQPQHEFQITMYTCGPSTYQRPHIGNYRTFLFEDILQRYLEYLGYKVTRLMTLTDIEDKAIAQAEKEGISVQELTNRNEKVFLRESKELDIKSPNFMVRASTIVDQATKLIDNLLKKGIAYRFTFEYAENIYFDPLMFPEFGKLAHLDMKSWPRKRRRFHLDTYPGMPWNRGDFILWHGCRSEDKVCWKTCIGRGRPAWNVQDAAMVTKHLGFSVDLACGGVDNLVRHHDYTIAIAESISGKPFSKYWLHGGHLFVDGKKMSKSKGNILFPKDLMVKGFENSHIRFFLIYGDYKKKLNFNWERLSATSQKLEKFKTMVKKIEQTKSSDPSYSMKTIIGAISSVFEKFMNQDLNVKSAFDAIYKIILQIDHLSEKKNLKKQELDEVIVALRRIDQVMQIIF